jgi:UDP-N-acetylglucosamine 2-epimerase
MAGVKNLENEGITQKICTGALITAGYFKKHTLNATADKPVVINTGDVMQDVILYTAAVAGKNSTIIKDMSLSAKEYYLLTVHRAENTDSAARLCEIIKFVNKTSDNKAVVFPMHPRTKKMYRNSTAKFANNVRIVDPVGYFDLIQLLKNAKMLMTDSGGMQKEAFWLAVPCITLRNETEWIETIESGWNVLFKNYRGKHKILRNNLKCYGDGNAAKRIGEAIFALIANRTR